MLAHSGHPGIVKAKRFLRDSVWFAEIGKMVEEMVKECLPCHLQTIIQGQHLGLYKCPLYHKAHGRSCPWLFVVLSQVETYLLVVTEDFSRYPEVKILKSTSPKAVLPHLDSILARQGITEVLRTDSCPPFINESFQMFANHLGFTHRKITPVWPRANGEAERLMRTLEKAARAAVEEGMNWKQELFTFLRQYRATPHSTIGKSPSLLLNGRKLKSTLPRVQHDQVAPEIRQTDDKRKEEMKEYADRCN